jgi:hypothetical protein
MWRRLRDLNEVSPQVYLLSSGLVSGLTQLQGACFILVSLVDSA